jgi:Peptidase family M48
MSFIVVVASCGRQQALDMLGREELATGSRPLTVQQGTFSPSAGAVPLAAEAANRRNEGERVLRAVAVFLPDLNKVLKTYGTPDVTEVRRELEGFSPPFYITLFYRRPPRTLIYTGRPLLSFEQLADINAVPRSTQRQVFLQGPMPPPWPITISELRRGLRSAGLADAPRTDQPSRILVFLVPVSNEIRAGITEIHEGRSFDRASEAFARLNPASKVPGFGWRLVVFRSQENFAFSVPDGTIFLSEHVIGQVNDDELVAVIAHLLAHEAYGHDRVFWKEASSAEKVGAVTGLLVLGIALSPFWQVGPPSVAPKKNFAVYTRAQEAEANWAASGYLASINIPPDTLFDALLKLSHPPSDSPSQSSITHYRTYESAEFGHMHTADRSAADLGKMLDTGRMESSHYTTRKLR